MMAAQSEQMAQGAQPRTSGRLGMFVHAAIPDFITVWVLSVTMVCTVAFAFNSAAALQGNIVLMAALTAPVLLALFAGSWSKRALLPCGIVAGVLVVGYTVVGAAISPQAFAVDGVIQDSEENYLIFFLIAGLVPVVVFLLSRRPAGLVVLAVAVVLSCGFVQYLYRDWLTDSYGDIYTIVTVLALVTLFVYQCYRQSAYQAQRAKHPHFFAAWGFSAVLAALCVFVGCLVFYLVVTPAGLTTPEWKPFSDVRSAPVITYTGIYDKQAVDNEDVTTNQTDDQDQTNENTEEGVADENSNSLAGRISSFAASLSELVESYNNDSLDQSKNPIAYFVLKYGWIVMLLLIVAVCAAIIALKFYRRKRRLDKLEEQPLNYRIWSLYNFFIDRFAKLKVVKPDYLTPVEFAFASQRALAGFYDEESDTSFVDVTMIYVRSCLGACPVSQQDYDRVVAYYHAFFPNARKRVGILRWLFFKFWKL